MQQTTRLLATPHSSRYHKADLFYASTWNNIMHITGP